MTCNCTRLLTCIEMRLNLNCKHEASQNAFIGIAYATRTTIEFVKLHESAFREVASYDCDEESIIVETETTKYKYFDF